MALHIMDIPKFIPPVLIVAAIGWYGFFEWLRHRSYKKHIQTGFAPGTQHLLTAGIVGAFLLIAVSFVLMILRRTQWVLLGDYSLANRCRPAVPDVVHGLGPNKNVRPHEDYEHYIVVSTSDVGDYSCGRHDLPHSHRTQKADLIRHFAPVGLFPPATDRIYCHLHSAGYLVVTRA